MNNFAVSSLPQTVITQCVRLLPQFYVYCEEQHEVDATVNIVLVFTDFKPKPSYHTVNTFPINFKFTAKQP